MNAENHAMKLFRPLALFALTLGLAVVLGDVSVEAAQQPTKQEKQLKRKMLIEAAKAKIAATPAKPADPAKPPVAEPLKAALPMGPIGPVMLHVSGCSLL